MQRAGKIWGAIFVFMALMIFLPPAVLAESKVPQPLPGVKIPEFLTTQGGVGAGAPLDITLETFLKGIRKAYPKTNIRTIPGGSKDAIDRIVSGAVQVAATVPKFPHDAWLGKGQYKKANTKDFRLLYNMNVGFLANWVVDAKSNIRSVKDLNGKRIHCSSAGTSTNLYTIPAILATAGLSYEKIKANGGFIYTGSFRNALDMMSAGQLDAAFAIEPAPSASLNQYTLLHKVRMIPFTPEEQAAGEKVIGWVKTKVPKSMYAWLEGDVPSLTNSLSLAITTKLPENVVYNLLCAAYAVHQNWPEVAPAFKFIDAREEALKIHEVPLHAGAQKFFKAWGLPVGKSIVEKK